MESNLRCQLSDPKFHCIHHHFFFPHKFIEWGKAICEYLKARGHWADLVDPASGYPVILFYYNNVQLIQLCVQSPSTVYNVLYDSFFPPLDVFITRSLGVSRNSRGRTASQVSITKRQLLQDSSPSQMGQQSISCYIIYYF